MLDKACELLQVQIDFTGAYHCHAAKLMLLEVLKEHGQSAVDLFSREFDLKALFGFRPADRLF